MRLCGTLGLSVILRILENWGCSASLGHLCSLFTQSAQQENKHNGICRVPGNLLGSFRCAASFGHLGQPSDFNKLCMFAGMHAYYHLHIRKPCSREIKDCQKFCSLVLRRVVPTQSWRSPIQEHQNVENKNIVNTVGLMVTRYQIENHNSCENTVKTR